MESYDDSAYDTMSFNECAYEIILGAICDFFKRKKRFSLCIAQACRIQVKVQHDI